MEVWRPVLGLGGESVKRLGTDPGGSVRETMDVLSAHMQKVGKDCEGAVGYITVRNLSAYQEPSNSSIISCSSPAQP